MASIKKNFIYNSLYQLLIMFIPLITTPYISRVLGPNGVGTFSYSYSIASYYVLFIMLGLNNYGNRTIAKIRDDSQKLRQTFWSIYFMQLILGIVVNVLYCIYCICFSENIAVSLSIALYVVSASFDINWLFFGLEKFKITVVRNTIIKIATTVAIFLFVKTRDDVIMYCLIMTFGMFISQVVLWPFVLKNIKLYMPKPDEIKTHIKPNLFLFLTVIAVSLFKTMDKIMLGIMTTNKQVGFYESSEKIISLPLAFVTALGTVMLPRMSNLSSKGDYKKSNKILYLSIIFAMFLSSSMCFGIMGVSKEFVPIFYGSGYDICIKLFIILLPSCIFLSFANVIRTQYLLPHQMDNTYVISAFIGAGVNIIINILLIPTQGAIGAAIGTLFAEISVCIYQVYCVKNELPIGKYFRSSIPFVMSGIIMFLIIFNLSLRNVSQISLLFIKIIAGVILYFIILLIQLLLIKILKSSRRKC